MINVDVLRDIKTLQAALISLNRGTSEEKRMAIDSLESMLMSKLQDLCGIEPDSESWS
jgi:hypothetical protein